MNYYTTWRAVNYSLSILWKGTVPLNTKVLEDMIVDLSMDKMLSADSDITCYNRVIDQLYNQMEAINDPNDLLDCTVELLYGYYALLGAVTEEDLLSPYTMKDMEEYRQAVHAIWKELANQYDEKHNVKENA